MSTIKSHKHRNHSHQDVVPDVDVSQPSTGFTTVHVTNISPETLMRMARLEALDAARFDKNRIAFERKALHLKEKADCAKVDFTDGK